MSVIRGLALGVLVLGVAGCATVDTAARNTPLQSQVIVPDTLPNARSYDLTNVAVFVPNDLTVSEAGSYYPVADIVWRGDAIGNRHEQVGALFETAAARASQDLDGSVPVIAVITLVRFHGVTERTRFSVGGVYNMVFDLEVRHAVTGVVLEENRRIAANLPAPGGQAAVELERIGQTERVRVLDYLSFVIGRELGVDTTPGAPQPVEDFI